MTDRDKVMPEGTVNYYTISDNSFRILTPDIQIERFGFRCKVCGTYVKAGENFIIKDGIKTCTCMMPVRKLIPTGIRRMVFR